VWKRGEEDRLPACLNSQTTLLSEWDEILTSLCGLIGDSISDDLDEAYIDGFHMFESYYPMDGKGTVQIIQTATLPLPPHFKWFDWCLDFDAEMLGMGNPINKVLQSFIGPMDPLIMRPILTFSDDLHYSAPGQKRQDVWDANLVDYTLMAGSVRTDFYEQDSDEQSESARKLLGFQGFDPPSVCSSSDDIATLLREQVREKWGYDILADEAPPSLGAQYTRRACISLLCVANGILEPDWNRVTGP
jgi:hypothetical protein